MILAGLAGVRHRFAVVVALGCALALCGPSHQAAATLVVSGGGTLAGDVTGPSGANNVISLTGTGGGLVTWAPGQATPTLAQTINGTGTGFPLTVQAQAAKVGSGANGGTLNLFSGVKDGAGSNGAITIQSTAATSLMLDGSGNATINSGALNLLSTGTIAIESSAGPLFLDGTSHSFRDAGHVTRASIDVTHGVGTFGGGGSDTKTHAGPLTSNESTYAALWMLPGATSRSVANPVMYSNGNSVSWNIPFAGSIATIIDAGSSTITSISLAAGWVFGTGATPNFSQASSTSGAGVTTNFSAQAAKAASNTNGGDVSFTGGAGDGTGVAGRVLVQRLNPGVTVVGVIAVNTTLTNSQSNATLYTVNPSAAGLTLRIARAPAAGEMAIVRDLNAGGTAITVAWLTGTGIVCPALAACVLTGDGTNAVLILQGT